MRLIDADKLYPDRMTKKGLAISQSQIANAPTIESPKGHWINRRYIYPNKIIDMKVCSECGYEFSYDAETGISEANGCPNCLADMREEKDG